MVHRRDLKNVLLFMIKTLKIEAARVFPVKWFLGSTLRRTHAP